MLDRLLNSKSSNSGKVTPMTNPYADLMGDDDGVELVSTKDKDQLGINKHKGKSFKSLMAPE